MSDALTRALEHHRAGQLDQADAVYRALIAQDPGNIDALHFAGVVAFQRGRHDEAADSISQALARNDANPPAHNNLGNVRTAQGRLDDAIACYRKALALDPAYGDASRNLAAALTNQSARLYDQGKALEAAARAEEALALQPGLAHAHSNRGNALADLGRVAQAEESLRRALALDPQLASASLNLGFARLMQGDLESGFALLEQRFAAVRGVGVYSGVSSFAAQFDDRKRWNGQPAAGETLLVWDDQGLGDSLMMARYLPLLKERGFAEILVHCEPPLKRLLACVPGVDEVLPRSAPLEAAHYGLHCPITSLPFLFKTQLSSIPARVPYLFVPQDLKKTRLQQSRKPRIGLAWSGTTLVPRHALRSIRLAQLAPLFSVEGPTFFSLQKGEGASQLRELNTPVLDFMDECRDLLDTAVLVEELDLVISIDTAVAHLAGALGKPVWLLTRFESDWRWMLAREDSPWYPTVRIFRQRRPGDWDEVVQRVAAALRVLEPFRRAD